MSEYKLKIPKKLEDTVVGTYKKIENTVVGAYQKVEGSTVGGYKKNREGLCGHLPGKEGRLGANGQRQSSARQLGCRPVRRIKQRQALTGCIPISLKENIK